LGRERQQETGQRGEGLSQGGACPLPHPPPEGEHPDGHEGAKAGPKPIRCALPLPNPLPQAGEGAKAAPDPTYEAELKKRTLTNLYNARPAWLDHAHKELDMAVAAAYGWTDYTPEMPDEEILRRLLALNLQRAAKPQA
jgi:hypothetical protein